MTAYFPAVTGHGKYHAANPVVGTAACGLPIVLDIASAPIVDDSVNPHPVVCRRCVSRAGPNPQHT